MPARDGRDGGDGEGESKGGEEEESFMDSLPWASIGTASPITLVAFIIQVMFSVVSLDASPGTIQVLGIKFTGYLGAVIGVEEAYGEGDVLDVVGVKHHGWPRKNAGARLLACSKAHNQKPSHAPTRNAGRSHQVVMVCLRIVPVASPASSRLG